MCKGVESVILFLEDKTTVLSNFINSCMTMAEPFLAAICAQVLPSLVADDTSDGRASRNSSMTSGLSEVAAR